MAVDPKYNAHVSYCLLTDALQEKIMSMDSTKFNVMTRETS